MERGAGTPQHRAAHAPRDAGRFLNYVDRGNLATAAPLIQDQLGLTATQHGLLGSAFYYAYVPLMPAAGWVAEHAGAKRVLAAGMAIWSTARRSYSFSTPDVSFAGGKFPAAERSSQWLELPLAYTAPTDAAERRRTVARSRDTGQLNPALHFVGCGIGTGCVLMFPNLTVGTFVLREN